MSEPSYIAFLESLMGPIDPNAPGDELDLSTCPKTTWAELDGSKVRPTAAIRRYLDSDDVLTNHTIDMMELALEKTYGVEEPWFITSRREGSEDEGNLKLCHFFLMKEA